MLKSVSFFIVHVHKLSSADSWHTIPCWAWKQNRAEELQSRRPLRSWDATNSTNGQGFRSELRASSQSHASFFFSPVFADFQHIVIAVSAVQNFGTNWYLL